MPLTTAGNNFLAGVATGAQTTHFDNANAKLGVGDSATAFAIAQTDLQAASNKIRKAMDATFPTTVGAVITLQSTYTSAEANYAWNEWGVFNAASAGTMLTRKVEYNGTKLVGQTWILQVQLTVSIGA
jgi:hypothetical protein